MRETAPEALAAYGAVAGGRMVWSFVTYAFLHADWGHVLLNSLWLVAFGAPVGWRFGAPRFLLFAAVGAIAGAAFHLVFYCARHVAGDRRLGGDLGADGRRQPLRLHTGRADVGASRGGSLSPTGAAACRSIARDRRVLAFVGIWFGVNIVFGLTSGAGLASGAVAWDAHIGGFLAGLLLFPLFDPVPRAAANRRLLRLHLVRCARTSHRSCLQGWEATQQRHGRPQ